MVVVKNHEMEIGYPTNVKHLAHIGSAGNAPTGCKTCLYDRNIRIQVINPEVLWSNRGTSG